MRQPLLRKNMIVDEMTSQVRAAQMVLTSDEAFYIVFGAGHGAGLEAWRHLQCRYDPGTAGTSEGLV